MAQYVREIMTQNPVTVQMRDTITAVTPEGVDYPWE